MAVRNFLMTLAAQDFRHDGGSISICGILLGGLVMQVPVLALVYAELDPVQALVYAELDPVWLAEQTVCRFEGSGCVAGTDQLVHRQSIHRRQGNSRRRRGSLQAPDRGVATCVHPRNPPV